MTSRRLLSLVAVVSVLLVVVVGTSRATADGRQCPDRVWSSALDGLTDRQPSPCAAASMDRIYGIAVGLMGLVLISGLLARRD